MLCHGAVTGFFLPPLSSTTSSVSSARPLPPHLLCVLSHHQRELLPAPPAPKAPVSLYPIHSHPLFIPPALPMVRSSASQSKKAKAVQRCQSCSHPFRGNAALTLHIARKKACRWLLQAPWEKPLPRLVRHFADGVSDCESDPDLSGDDMGEDWDPLDERSPPPDEPLDALHDHIPLPASASARSTPQPDHDSDPEIYPGAGAPAKHQPKLHPPQPAPINPYHPFLSRLEWTFARWAKVDQIGFNRLDRLLSIPGVSALFIPTFFF